jgi:hypothetical protein
VGGVLRDDFQKELTPVLLENGFDRQTVRTASKSFSAFRLNPMSAKRAEVEGWFLGAL